MSVYQVESILEKKYIQNGKCQYLIKWKGYSIQQSTWQPQENLQNCSRLMKQFLQRQKQKINEEKKKQAIEAKKKAQVKLIQDDKKVKQLSSISNKQEFYYEDEQQLDLTLPPRKLRNSDSASQQSFMKKRGRPKKQTINLAKQNTSKSLSIESGQGKGSSLKIIEPIEIKKQKQKIKLQPKPKTETKQHGIQVQFSPSPNIKILTMHYKQSRLFPSFSMKINDKFYQLAYAEVYLSYPFALAQFYSQYVQFYPPNLRQKENIKRQKGIGKMAKLKKQADSKELKKYNSKPKQKGTETRQQRLKKRQSLLQEMQEDCYSSEQDESPEQPNDEVQLQESNLPMMNEKIQPMISHEIKAILEESSEENREISS